MVVYFSYLALGNSLPSLANYWQIGKSTAYDIVQETCRVISNTIGATYLLPSNQQEYREIADKFWQRWNLPNCVGALDGKHIRIQCPANTGSQFFNYKQYFSIVLMATCDANYCFTSIHIGDYGSLSDSSVFSATEFGQAVENDTLNIPPPSPLPGTNIMMPYFFVGDEIFPLRQFDAPIL
ncbi:uncharacterized protein LOC105431657 isoform X1 [Pogonomyrmex barbatus]|uniref:Uncharacterized protein LOC105431657 isoform X1 n=1 Tax=Pogonomyrmex barbatus TaxID=144034 RepID=A0A6I9XG33_9HYME|nr:uncharacterized protein LOC105431657 isoform X1 [Pogonomyrmex barbatus]